MPLSPASLPRTLSLLALLGLAVGLGPIACERHPADEPAEGYGHGSAHPDSKAGDTHRYDGTTTRFSDSQGVGIESPRKGQSESETHASGPEHGRPGPGGQHAPKQDAPEGKH